MPGLHTLTWTWTRSSTWKATEPTIPARPASWRLGAEPLPPGRARAAGAVDIFVYLGNALDGLPDDDW